MSTGVIGMLPSFSHSQAAAMEPRMVASAGDPETSMASVE